MSFEAGYLGRLVSLGGIVGADGKGRVVKSTTLASSANVTAILANNPKRIAALIQNGDTTNVAFVYLGTDTAGTFTSNPIVLNPGGSLQIDVNLPWTGEVMIVTAAVAVSVVATEISVI